jgi:hypothetical protein
LASEANHLAGLAFSEPHLAHHLANGVPNLLGAGAAPLKTDQLQKPKASHWGGLRKKASVVGKEKIKRVD